MPPAVLGGETAQRIGTKVKGKRPQINTMRFPDAASQRHGCKCSISLEVPFSRTGMVSHYGRGAQGRTSRLGRIADAACSPTAAQARRLAGSIRRLRLLARSPLLRESQQVDSIPNLQLLRRDSPRMFITSSGNGCFLTRDTQAEFNSNNLLLHTHSCKENCRVEQLMSRGAQKGVHSNSNLTAACSPLGACWFSMDDTHKAHQSPETTHPNLAPTIRSLSECQTHVGHKAGMDLRELTKHLRRENCQTRVEEAQAKKLKIRMGADHA